jgi:hypothetical protein
MPVTWRSICTAFQHPDCFTPPKRRVAPSAVSAQPTGTGLRLRSSGAFSGSTIDLLQQKNFNLRPPTHPLRPTCTCNTLRCRPCRTPSPWPDLPSTCRQLQLRNSDLLYFVPQLSSQPYLSNPDASTSISVNLSGSVADFAAADLQIEAGEGTLLRTDLAVTGLPAVDSTVFSVPGLRLSSGRQDIAMLTGARLPEGLFLPG